MDSIGSDKRRYPRIEDAVCAWLLFRQDRAAYGTLTMDLGLEGARFSTLRKVNTGENVLISLQLPAASIECKGRVCWTQLTPNGLFCFGVRFLDLREAERDHLGRYLYRVSHVASATARPMQALS